MSLQGMEEQEEDDELRSTSNTSSKSYKPLTEDGISFRELSTANTRPTSTDTVAAALEALVDPKDDVTHVLNTLRKVSSAELQSTID